MAAAGVPGRGEYGKTCTLPIARSSTTRAVRRKAASSSPGKPTIASVVRLTPGSASRARRQASTYAAGS